MTEKNKCCGFCLSRSNIDGKCMLNGENVKFNDCCDRFVPMDWSFKR